MVQSPAKPPPSAPTLNARITRVPVLRRGEADAVGDFVAVEEPLEIRLAGETVAVIVRTPGDDHKLALGYLYGEGIIDSAQDATVVYHCGRPGEEGYGNVIEISPAAGARIDWDRLDASRRGGITNSACGVCGRASIDDLMKSISPMPPVPPLPAARIAQAMEALRSNQPAFEATGGTHAAALWARDGSLIAAHEDVGRHNTVDKIVGALLLMRAGGAEPEPALLTVSGRAGFEIVQKAARAAIPVVASVSAPTSLSVELARTAGVALLGFVRNGRMNVYTCSERISG